MAQHTPQGQGGDGAALHPSQSHLQPRDWGLVGSGCFGEPPIPPWRRVPLAAPTSSPGRPGRARLQHGRGHSGSSGAEQVPGGAGGATGFADRWRGLGGCSPPSQLGPS